MNIVAGIRLMISTIPQLPVVFSVQTTANSFDFAGSIFPILGMLFIIVLVGGLGLYFIRRWVRRESNETVAFTLGDLREMLESGDITSTEFQAARDAMIAQVKKQTATKEKDGKYTPKKFKSNEA